MCSFRGGRRKSGSVDDRIDAFANRIDAFADRTDVVADRTDAFADRTDAVADRTDAFADRTDAFADRIDAFVDRTDAVADRADAVADGIDAVTDRTDAVADSIRRRFTRAALAADDLVQAFDHSIELFRRDARNALPKAMDRQRANLTDLGPGAFWHSGARNLERQRKPGTGCLTRYGDCDDRSGMFVEHVVAQDDDGT